MKNKLILTLSIIVSTLLVALASCTSTHQHEYSDKYKFDNDSHWQESLCGHGDSDHKAHDMKLYNTINPTFENVGYNEYKCSVCPYTKKEEIAMLEHTYSDILSFDDKTHWYPCIDSGYESLKKEEQAHDDSNEVVITPSTDTAIGLGEYTCSICNHTYQKPILIKTSIKELPTISNDIIYIGQVLSTLDLLGGAGSVAGEFKFTNPNEIVTESKEYSVTFYPNEDEKYDTIDGMIYINATQLTVEVIAYDNGSVNPNGVVNVNYNQNLELSFNPNSGYQVKEVLIDGVSIGYKGSYTLENITDYQKVEVYFDQKPALPFTLVCASGNNDCYSFIDNTLYFSAITEETSYYIAGELEGNIIIDTGEDYDFELEMQGFTLTSSSVCPIVILSGNEVAISAKKDTKNYIYDNRELVDSESEVINYY